MLRSADSEPARKSRIFSGNIFIYQAFDIGEDIDLEKAQQKAALSKPILMRCLNISKITIFLSLGRTAKPAWSFPLCQRKIT